MKTIEKLLRYKFNRKQRRYLQAQWYMNWCGGKWGFNFSRTITDIIEELHGFQKDFYKKLLLDLEKLCWEHDIDFTLGGTKWDFRKANFIFAYKVFKLTSWNKWRHIFGRIWLMLIIYILLNRHGKYYFNFKSKKTLEDLFKNYKESNEKNY
jgi:hypothetical protein